MVFPHVETAFEEDESSFLIITTKVRVPVSLPTTTSAPQRFTSQRAPLLTDHACNGSSRRREEFSPTEQAIMAAVTDQWQTRQQIADACNMPCSGAFSAILTNLVERNYLLSSQRGYRLNPD